MKRIGIVANFTKPVAEDAVRKLAEYWTERGATLTSEDDIPGGLERMISSAPIAGADLVFALGGDGTMLRAVRLMGERQAPVVGVNLGGLGFLTTVTLDRLDDALKLVEGGQYGISERIILRGTIRQAQTGGGSEYHALNDFAMGWGETTRVATLEITVNGEAVTSYVCDGLIVSTPTGSTGHSLSAGGPIVHPGCDVMIVNPICPHTLSNRPLVLAADSVVEIQITDTPKKLLFSADGQEHALVAEGDRLTITRSNRTARIVFLEDTRYFSLLRQKLHWRGSSV